MLAEARRALPLIEKPGRGTIRCPTGEARVTVSGDLECEWVIHAVGPNYRTQPSQATADALLYSAYRSAMREAHAKRAPDVAFSLLSAGVFRGERSLRDVLGIAVLAVSGAAYEGLQDVFMVGFTTNEVELLTELIEELCVASPEAERAAARFLEALESPEVMQLHGVRVGDAENGGGS